MLDPEEHKEKTAHNRAASPELLTRAGISFVAKNNGAHLIVSAAGETFDFWPGTGKYNRRGLTRYGVTYSYKRGVFNLIRDIETLRKENQRRNGK